MEVGEEVVDEDEDCWSCVKIFLVVEEFQIFPAPIFGRAIAILCANREEGIMVASTVWLMLGIVKLSKEGLMIGFVNCH